uniref:Uncharacterized protein n=1 Tax=Sphaeramia orbicularis TaxID=375764 RepID=A0A673AH05_9TELE
MFSGRVLESRSQLPWGLSTLTDFFWGVVEFIGLFFKTLIDPDLTKDGRVSVIEIICQTVDACSVLYSCNIMKILLQITSLTLIKKLMFLPSSLHL